MGKKENSNSLPVLSLIKNIIDKETVKWVKVNIQFFLKLLRTAKALGLFSSIADRVKKETKITGNKYLVCK